jgi:hypothetical protein
MLTSQVEEDKASSDEVTQQDFNGDVVLNTEDKDLYSSLSAGSLYPEDDQEELLVEDLTVEHTLEEIKESQTPAHKA